MLCKHLVTTTSLQSCYMLLTRSLQWDHDRNQESGNFPDNTTLGSGKLIWWQCYKCPRGKVHSWQARASHRTHKMSAGCPYCAGHQICECNSLETVCAAIAADFDVEKNGVSAAEVTSAATTKHSWLSDEPGAKKRSVNRRTNYTRKMFITEARRLQHTTSHALLSLE